MAETPRPASGTFTPSVPKRVVIATYALAVLAMGAASVLKLGDADMRQLVLNASYVVGSLALVASCGMFVFREGRPVDPRVLWLLAAGLLWLFGECWWFYYQQVATSQPHPSLSDFGFLAALLCIAGLVGTYLPATTDKAARRRVVVDGLLISTGIFVLAWLLYAEQALEGVSGPSPLELTVLAAYPVVDVALLSLVALAMRHGLARDASLRVLAAALVSYVLADVGWNVASVHGTYTPGSAPFDAGWSAAFGLLALLPWLPSARRRAEASFNATSFRWSIWPVALAAVATLALGFFDYDGLQRADLVLLGLLVCLTLVRQMLLTRDFLDLARSLEHQVADRTEDLRTSHDRMRHLALHDSLTGLANRRRLIDALDEAATCARTGGGPGALVLLDLDDFKNINDTLGHPRGDELLVEVGLRLHAAARAEDLVARLGGDEFAVLLTGADERDARAMVERMISLLNDPLTLANSHTISPRASAGLTMLHDDINATEAMMRADMAMYAAKRGGKNAYAAYNFSMDSATVGKQPSGDVDGNRRTSFASQPATVTCY